MMYPILPVSNSIITLLHHLYYIWGTIIILLNHLILIVILFGKKKTYFLILPIPSEPIFSHCLELWKFMSFL